MSGQPSGPCGGSVSRLFCRTVSPLCGPDALLPVDAFKAIYIHKVSVVFYSVPSLSFSPPGFECFRLLIGGLIGRILLAGCISLVLTRTGRSVHQDKRSQSHPPVIVCFRLKSWLYILTFIWSSVLPRKYLSDAAPVGVLNSVQLHFICWYIRWKRFWTVSVTL